MSKSSIIGLTPPDSSPALPLVPGGLTPEQKAKLVKSVGRVASRHGWTAFARALAEVCQGGANCWHTHPEVAALWQYRAETLRALAERGPESVAKGTP
jgi:hypothetical protein